MTTSLWLRNLGAFGIQSGLLVAAGSLLVWAFRIDKPHAALAYWRALLLACLLLPFCQPWHTVASQVTTVAAATDPVAGGGVTAPAAAGVTVASGWPSAERLIAIAVAVGIAVRTVWLAIGAWVLGRIRREAEALDPVPDAIARAQDLVGVAAQLCVSTRTAGPLTFGFRRPIVVFPPAIASLDASVQHAIACHELLHVRRHDWIVQVVEEGIRTIFWFHPGVWWLVGRIQLTREQVVDQESIALVDSPDRYVEALLVVAIARSPGFFTPAPAFFRRSLLKKRVARILQEKTMTTRRLMISLGASAAALAIAATVAVHTFPLQAQGQPRSAGSQPIEIVKGGEHLLHGALPEYPHRAIEQKVEGDVLLDLAVDDQGEVSDARVLSGPDELRKAALGSVLGWHYAPSAVRSASVQATIRFTLAAANAEFRGIAYTAERTGESKSEELTHPQQLERQITELSRALEDPAVKGPQRDEYKAKLAEATAEMAHIQAERAAMDSQRVIRVREGVSETHSERSQEPLRLMAFKTERVSADAASEVMKRAGVKVGDTITEDSLRSIRAAATAVDEHFKVAMHDEGHGRVSLVLVSRE